MKKIKVIFSIFFALSTTICTHATSVKAWEDTLEIPTYKIRPAETAPMFNRMYMYQRAKRAIYPYLLNDNMNITQKKENVKYKALFLENKYIKVCVLPEIGGRLFYAIDKTNNYDIFYKQDVIKPAIVGMNGAWISGGVEWNVFHHHRITSHTPVDYKIVANDDGSKTIWVGETERRHRMSWSIGVTVFPDKSYMKIDGRLINATHNSNSMLFWANASTHSNENYQIIFPQNTEFGVYHAKNSFCHWPISYETYNGTEAYQNGVKVDLWKAHPVGNSIFAHERKEDFIAGYDYGKDAGTMMYANRHISAGGKFWSWGPNSGWPTKVLTDTAGHYIELMMGAYSDNQPDYNWTLPYEVKSFTQYYYGIRNIKGAKKASKLATLNLDVITNDKAFLGVNATEQLDNVEVVLSLKGKAIYSEKFDIDPSRPFIKTVPIPANTKESDLKMVLLDTNGKELLAYQAIEKNPKKPLPETVKTPLPPNEIKNTEECFYVGLRTLQFHNGFLNALDYFEEVLRRDPKDVRTNTILGAYWRQRGDYEKARKYLETAIARQTKDYTRPNDCEATYNLALVLKEQGKIDQAIEMFYKASWNYTFTSASNTQLAQIYSKQKNYASALECLDEAIAYNTRNFSAQNLKASVLRTLGNKKEAIKCVEAVLSIDPLNAYANCEKYLLDNNSDDFEKLMRDEPESYVELAIKYINNGFISEAQKLLEKIDSKINYATVKMWLGYIADKNGDKEEAKKMYVQALDLPVSNVFRLETVDVLMQMSKYIPNNWKIYYYLGNLYYDNQPDKALNYWHKCTELKADYALAWRNIGWANHHYAKNLDVAEKAYLKAIELEPQAVYFEELDEILESKKASAKYRFDILNKHHNIIVKRYFPSVSEIILAVFLGKNDYALDLLRNGYYPTGENVKSIHDVYVDALMMSSLEKSKTGDFAQAIKLLQEAFTFPENHQIFLYDTRIPRDAQIYYMIAKAYEKMGDKEKAKQNYIKSVETNVGKTDFRYWKALALTELGRKEEATVLFKALVETGNSKIVKRYINFFAEGDLRGIKTETINAQAYYTLGLGELGLGNIEKAKKAFITSNKLEPNKLWTTFMLNSIK